MRFIPTPLLRNFPAFLVSLVPARLVRHLPALLMRFIPTLLLRNFPAFLVSLVPARLVRHLPASLLGLLPTLLMRLLPAFLLGLLPTLLVDYIFAHLIGFSPALLVRNLLALLGRLGMALGNIATLLNGMVRTMLFGDLVTFFLFVALLLFDKFSNKASNNSRFDFLLDMMKTQASNKTQATGPPSSD